MDKPTIRRIILESIANRAPAPSRLADIARDPDVAMCRLADTALAAECQELESRGYLVNIKNAVEPVYKGIAGAARDQLDMAGKLDPAIWGDIAL